MSRYETDESDLDLELEINPDGPPIPPIRSGDVLARDQFPRPPQLIQGMLHQGSKMLLAGRSKTYKSWCLMDLALSVAAGKPWWGRPTTAAPVLYINFELPEWSFDDRLRMLLAVRPELKNYHRNWSDWQLRGAAADFTKLRPLIERRMDPSCKLVVLDPAYKLLGDRDENSNSDIASLLNQFDQLAQYTQAAVVFAHHFSKGDPTAKDPIDRMCGAGSWARDPDSILVLTPHEQPECFTVDSILRNLPPMPEFVVEWRYPVMVPAPDLDPASVRRRTRRRKVTTDREFLTRVVAGEPQPWKVMMARAKLAGIAETTAKRYIRRLTGLGIIRHEKDPYWIGNPMAGGAQPASATN